MVDAAADTVGPAELVRLAAVARRFYIDRRSKLEIAEEFGLSRFKVARLLDHALARGIVRIEVGVPARIDAELSEALRSTCKLRHAIVVDTPEHPETDLRAHLARVAAGLLTETVVEGDILGLGYGRTITDMTESLTRLAPCTVVQLSGALLGVNVQENTIELVRRVAAVSGGPAFPIYTPQVLPDFATAEALRRQSQVAEAGRRWNQLTKAVVAIGSWDPPHSQLYLALSQRERDALRARGACAEICANLLDADGRPVATDFTDRCITITAAQLRTVDEVIAVGGGHDKVAALRAVLRGGYATSLITDVIVARALLEQPPSVPA
ncbi:MAG TPA: sugar-binding domain-containing protein [Actinomycetes bacterium]